MGCHTILYYVFDCSNFPALFFFRKRKKKKGRKEGRKGGREGWREGGRKGKMEEGREEEKPFT